MFPLNPVKDEIYIVANKEWLFNGYGFVLVPDSSLTEESDPIWNSEKHEYAKRAELQDYVPIDILDSTLVDYVKQEEISDIIPQFQKIITQDQFVWYNDYLLIDIGEISHSKKVTVLSLYIYTSKGIIKGTPIVSYPTAKVNSDSLNFTYFYLKDTIGIISKSNDIEKISISFNTSIQNKEVDIQGTLGRNILFEETSGNRVHGEFVMDSFHGVYPENAHQKILSIDLPETSGNIVQSFQPYLCSKYECNLVTKPYVNAAVSENYLSNPEILTIGAHYDNTERRRDITSAPDKFLSNTIAVSAGTSKDDTNSLWTSYGYGVEFFESWKKEEIDQRYPNKLLDHAIARIITTPDNQGLIYKSDGTGWPAIVEVGQKVRIRYSASNEVEVTVTDIISNSEIRIDQTVTPILEADSHKYVYTYVTVGARGYYRPQQSPVCGIVAAKFRKIQDKTNANWQVCREAARATASNSTFTLDGTDKIWTTNWDMYRGFGIIDVDLAVEYIHQHYIDNKEYKKSAAYTLPKSNPFLGVDDIERDTFVSKANLEEYVERFSESIFLPQNQLDALNNAINPSGTNPFATELELDDIRTNFAKISGSSSQDFTVKDLTIHGTVNHWLADTITVDDANLQLNAVQNSARVSSGLIIYDTDSLTQLSKLHYDINNRWRLDLDYIATESWVSTQINTRKPNFSENSAFNKNFGTAAGTVAQGNDSRINNGQTAYGWGNHALFDYATKQNLDDLEIGGRNLVEQTNQGITNIVAASSAGAATWTASEEIVDGVRCAKGTKNTTAVETWAQLQLRIYTPSKFRANQQYAISFKMLPSFAINNQVTRLSTLMNQALSTNSGTYSLVAGKWNHVKLVVTTLPNFDTILAGGTAVSLRLPITGNSSTDDTVLLKDIMIVEGNKASAYAPAPEDVTAYVDNSILDTRNWTTANFAPLTPSDVRLKENIHTMPSALESVNRLRPVSFNYKSDKSKKEQYGFIAQELREDFPQFVGGKETEDEYLNVDYANVVVPLTKAVQELTAMVSAMQEEINKLKNEM